MPEQPKCNVKPDAVWNCVRFGFQTKADNRDKRQSKYNNKCKTLARQSPSMPTPAVVSSLSRPHPLLSHVPVCLWMSGLRAPSGDAGMACGQVGAVGGSSFWAGMLGWCRCARERRGIRRSPTGANRHWTTIMVMASRPASQLTHS